MPPALRNLPPALAATTALLVPLLLAFLLPRLLLHNWPALAPKFFLGYITLLFLLTTTACILWTARANSFSTAFLGYALIVDSAALLLLILALSANLLSFPDIFRLYLLLLTWVAAWSALAYLLRRRPALAVAISLTLSAILFASPISALPLAHASSHWSQPTHENVLQSISYTTPILPAFDTLKTSLPAAEWPEWTMMYRLSDISQELALRAHWHYACLAYALIALAIVALNSLLPRPAE